MADNKEVAESGAAAASSSLTSKSRNTDPCNNPVICLRHDGVIPLPGPAQTGPTPQQLYEMELESKAAKERAKEEADAAKPKPDGFAAGVTSLFSKVTDATQKLANNASETSERKIREYEHNKMNEQFRNLWPSLVACGDKFVVSFPASVLSMGVPVPGDLFISEQHISFYSAHSTGPGGHIKDAWPFAVIACIARSISMETEPTSTGHAPTPAPPYIMPIPAPQVIPNAIQLFCTDSKLIQLTNFDSTVAAIAQSLGTGVKGTPISRFFSYADHQWRKATTVPLPGAKYAKTA